MTIPGEPLAARYNWCQGPVPGRGPAVEKHCFTHPPGSPVQEPPLGPPHRERYALLLEPPSSTLWVVQRTVIVYSSNTPIKRTRL